ncbi:hypothetical protein CEXT_124551 [Caerostris extrusa]|uniref:Uncharacterized protein n=1 Tax=Caerostris extrusa TaxID=172846 RepID=A0AAV4XJQ3_CAEEX|nr:hypothetical protein CEXT_124551 [Caerostris extrusa]
MPPLAAQPVKNYLEGQNWEVLPEPDIAPSGYHLLPLPPSDYTSFFKSKQLAFSETQFTTKVSLLRSLAE